MIIVAMATYTHTMVASEVMVSDITGAMEGMDSKVEIGNANRGHGRNT